MYEDVHPLFTAKKAGQLQVMLVLFVIYCFVKICTVQYGYKFCRDQIFVDFVKFLIHDN